MITQELLADQIIAYLNGQLTLQALVDWAEDAIVTFTKDPDERPENGNRSGIPCSISVRQIPLVSRWLGKR